MDIEQLKLVISAVENVSGNALTVTGLWLGKDLLLSLVGYSLAGYAVYRLIGIVGMIAQYLTARSEFEGQLMAEIGAAAYLDASDKRRVVELIRLGKKSEAASK
jgi:hypothetical protein